MDVTEAVRLRLRNSSNESPTTPSGAWRWLADHPEDAAELADLLNEAAPTLSAHLPNYPKLTPPRTPGTHSFSQQQSGHATSQITLQRLRNAIPIPTAHVNWSSLQATITSEMLSVEDEDNSIKTAGQFQTPTTFPPTTPGGSLVEVNSGGRVFFCLFQLDSSQHHPRQEGCLVLKFNPSRLLCQSEQFACELARHVGICAPESRILRAAATTSVDDEWTAALSAAENISTSYPELLEEMNESGSVLVMEYIPGKGIFQSPMAFQPCVTSQNTFHDLGRLVALDLLLGNSDRLRCEALGWRGNPENILCATSGRWEGRLVAIDAVVQRRPPGKVLSAEDAACERVLELTLNDGKVAEGVLSESVSSCPAAVAALAADTAAAVTAFQHGLRKGLDSIMGLKGLLEMMFEVVTEWIDSLIEDIEGVAPAPLSPPLSARRGGSAGLAAAAAAGNATTGGDGGGGGVGLQCPAMTTYKIRMINLEASHNQSVSEKLGEWKAAFRARGEDLRAAVEEWQAKRSAAAAAAELDRFSPPRKKETQSGSSTPMTPPSLAAAADVIIDAAVSPRSAATSSGVTLSTGFLDGTHPVVDVYELKVRLEHMLQRLRVLQQAIATAPPTRLLPGLYLSGAVEASSLHLLRYYGITHVLNATEDLLLPEDDQCFVGESNNNSVKKKERKLH